MGFCLTPQPAWGRAPPFLSAPSRRVGQRWCEQGSRGPDVWTLEVPQPLAPSESLRNHRLGQITAACSLEQWGQASRAAGTVWRGTEVGLGTCGLSTGDLAAAGLSAWALGKEGGRRADTASLNGDVRSASAGVSGETAPPMSPNPITHLSLPPTPLPQLEGLTRGSRDTRPLRPQPKPPTVQPGQHRPPHGQDQAQGRAEEEEVGHVEVQATQAGLRRLGPPGRRGLGLVLQHTGVDAAPGRKSREGRQGSVQAERGQPSPPSPR